LLAPEEELQLLETKHIVLDEKHDDYDPTLHDPYTRCLVKNRLFALRAALSSSLAKGGTVDGGASGAGVTGSSGEAAAAGGSGAMVAWEVSHPPRDGGSGWPFYQDATALGEVYNSTSEIESVSDWEALLRGPSIPGWDTSFGTWVALRNFATEHGAAIASAKAAAAGVAQGTTSDATAPVLGGRTSSLAAGTCPPPPKAPSLRQLPGADDGAGSLDRNTSRDSSLVDRAAEGPASLAEVAEHEELLAACKASPKGLQGWFKENGGGLGAGPPGGFLSVVVFQVLWDPECVKAVPAVEELAPAFPAVKFNLVRADRVGVDAISREQDVKQFPTVLILRGDKEVSCSQEVHTQSAADCFSFGDVFV